MKSHFGCLAVVVVVAAVVFSAGKAHAIPAFARLYKTECNTCHTIFPDRKPFGDAFRKNSYVWPGKLPEQMPEEIQYLPKEGGERAKPWLTAIPDQVPISLWVNHDIILNKEKTPQFDMDGQTELEMFTGGSFRGKAGWWAEYNFVPDHDIGEVYTQLRHVIGSPVNVKVGKFKPKLSLWKDNDSSTISSYGYNEMVVGSNPLVQLPVVDPVTGVTLVTSIGNPFMITREQGAIEVNSLIGNRLFAAYGITTPPEKDRNGPDMYGHLSVRIGGTDFAGSEPEISLTRESIWDNLALTFGTFGYFGSSNNFFFDETSNKNIRFKNDFFRLGLESEVLYKNLRFRLNSIWGEDKDPQGPAGTGQKEKSLWVMAQGQYIFMQNILAAMRYEHQDIEHEGITRRYIPTVVYAPWQNVKAGLEYVHEIRPRVFAPGAPHEYITREYTLRLTYAY